MGQAMRAALRQGIGGVGYQVLAGQFDEFTERITDAIAERDPFKLASLRLERAMVELQLRDLYGGPWTPDGGRWERWMRDDLAQAQRIARMMERAVGDSEIWDRFLIPFPRLRALAPRVAAC